MTATSVRHPAVAGRFYPRDAEILREAVDAYLSQTPGQRTVQALGCVVPHAGYVYSGHVTGAVFAGLLIPELCVVMCPNHTGRGHALSIMSEGTWETPLGNVPIDSDFAGALKRRCAILEEDSVAHQLEHAAEVELPFLQMLQRELRLVPIALGTGRFDVLEHLGVGLADVIAAQDRRVLMVASSDMNHYESDAITRVKDESAIDAILQLDAARLHEIVMQKQVSMCGFGPAIVMLTAAKKLGATRGELIKYATSGDISGDREAVVGYAGIVVR